jgi:PAS domain S-box-containing protein
MTTDRELQHFVTDPERFRILQIVLQHAEQLPTEYEIDQFCPELDTETVRDHLDGLAARNILRTVHSPEAEAEDYPAEFYTLTDEGWRFLLNHDLLDTDVMLRWQDVEIEDPRRLAEHESAPRPADVNPFDRPTETALDERLEAYKLVVEQTRDALYLLDADGRYVLVNDAYEELTGYSRAELLGATTGTVLDGEQVAERRDIILDLRNEDSDRQSRAWQSTLRTAEGESLPVEVTLSAIEYNGEFLGIVGSARDISARERRRQELSVLSRVLRHNLGNKVTVVQGYAEVVQQRIDDDVALDHVERILRTSQKLIDQSEKAREIQTLLQSWPPESRPQELTDVVWDILTELEVDHPGVTFRTEMPDSAWARVPDEVSMAIEELVANALEHTETDEPTVQITVSETDQRTVEVVVDDDGPGIPDEEVEVLTSHEETALNHSAGLGLWLVNWVVEAADGTLSFEDSEGGGSRVRMAFPRAEPPALTLSM